MRTGRSTLVSHVPAIRPASGRLRLGRWIDFTLEGSVGLHEQSSGPPATPGNPVSNGRNSCDVAGADFRSVAIGMRHNF